MVKPFRFGVQCGGDHDRASWEQLVHKIEALGYATVYLPDHFIETQMADMAELVPGAIRAAGRTASYVEDDYREVFRAWRAMYNLASVE